MTYYESMRRLPRNGFEGCFLHWMQVRKSARGVYVSDFSLFQVYCFQNMVHLLVRKLCTQRFWLFNAFICEIGVFIYYHFFMYKWPKQAVGESFWLILIWHTNINLAAASGTTLADHQRPANDRSPLVSFALVYRQRAIVPSKYCLYSRWNYKLHSCTLLA